jgi:hypothetical protein
MDEGTMGAVLGLLIIAGAFLAYRIEKTQVQLRHEIQLGIEKLEKKAIPDFPDIDELMDEVQEVIANTIGAMRVPTIADNLGNILQNWAQMKMAKEMQSMNSFSQLETVDKGETESD